MGTHTEREILLRQFTALSVLLFAPLAAAQPDSISVTFDPSVLSETYSGRIYLVLGPKESEPIGRMNAWFNPPPLVAWDVRNVKPGEPITLEGFDLAHAPESVGETWRTGEWSAQVVARVNPDSPKPGEGAGDLFSAPALVDMSQADENGIIASFTLDQGVTAPAFEETERTFLMTMPSELLSEFHRRPVEMRASVTVPESWLTDPDRTYPVVYYVTGFGGDESEVLRYLQGMPHKELVGDTILVGLDATNYWGHSVFADSAVTGPRGKALTTELIPALEAKYRGAQNPEHRYVTGISSGGWGSLWLQVEYPEVFAGTWSHVPDPVDFHAFQTVNLYEDGANMYTDTEGNPRPLGRRGEQVMFWAKDFIARERVLGPGGQIRSFEAVFSPALDDGTPARIFDLDTGAIDPQVAEAWKQYDINAKLGREWEEIGDTLAGKLHVFGGSMDNFYLGEAVGLLKDSMEQLGADEEIVVIDGMSHTFYWEGDRDMWETIAERWESTGK